MVILSREDILSADDGQLVPVDVPEWGGTVLVKPLSGDDRDRFEQSNFRRTPDGGMEPNLTGSRARLCQLSIVDEQGNRIFDKADIRKLGAKSSHALDRVAEAARKASGLASGQVEDTAEDFDEAEERVAGEALSSV